MKLFKTKVLGMPLIYGLVIVLVLVIGIIVGSFCDFDINVKLANPTNIGSIFLTYGSYVSYCLYPIAGTCLFKAVLKHGKKFRLLAWVLLIVSILLAVYYSNSYNGSKVRDLFGTFENGVPFYVSLLSVLFWIVLYSWIPVLFYFILDDSNPKLLIYIGITILLAGVLADNLNLWLKQLASRPRYRYLITLEDPEAGFKNWWEFNRYAAGSNDNFKSWPSGNMSIAAMVFAFPLALSALKKSNKIVLITTYILAFLFVILYGYNRMHMQAHFLSDVCFGALFCYLVFAIIDFSLQKILEIEK